MPYLPVGDTNLHYDDDGDGPAVVLIHGFGTSARVWNAQRAALVPEHRVVAYDARGCGRSGHRASGNTIERNVEDLIELLDGLGLDAPVIVGSSIGAVYAIEAARRGRASGVVSLDGPSHWGPEEFGPGVPQLRVDLRERRTQTLGEWVPGWYAPGTDPELIAWTLRQILDSGPFVDAIFDDAATYDPRPWLPEVDVPVVFVHGRHDEIPVAISEQAAALVPDSELIVVEQSGHMPHQEAPGIVNEAIRALVARTSYAPAST